MAGRWIAQLEVTLAGRAGGVRPPDSPVAIPGLAGRVHRLPHLIHANRERGRTAPSTGSTPL